MPKSINHGKHPPSLGDEARVSASSPGAHGQPEFNGIRMG